MKKANFKGNVMETIKALIGGFIMLAIFIYIYKSEIKYLNELKESK